MRARTGCTARGSAGRSAACSASRWRRSRARASGRSSTRPAGGRCRDYFTAWAAGRRRAPAGRGTGAARRPASPRTSTACPRTTTSTSRCWRCRCWRRTGRTSPAPTWRRRWLDWLPGGRVFTAERVAYRNLLDGLEPPETARRHNPFREWIGAQIRTDVYGWAQPRPAGPAPPSWPGATPRSATSAAGCTGRCGSPRWPSAAPVAGRRGRGARRRRVGAAAAQPVRRARSARRAPSARRPTTGRRVVDALYARHGHLHWVHVRNNAALVAAALAYGRGDFDRSICAVVAAAGTPTRPAPRSARSSGR